jgi:hypothetical protein
MEEQEKTYSLPPLIPTNDTPRLLIGIDYSLVYDHYSEVANSQGEEDFNRARKRLYKAGWTESDFKKVALIYENLRNNGFWPDGFDKDGHIQWRSAQASPIQQMMGIVHDPTEKIFSEKESRWRKRKQ